MKKLLTLFLILGLGGCVWYGPGYHHDGGWHGGYDHDDHGGYEHHDWH